MSTFTYDNAKYSYMTIRAKVEYNGQSIAKMIPFPTDVAADNKDFVDLMRHSFRIPLDHDITIKYFDSEWREWILLEPTDLYVHFWLTARKCPFGIGKFSLKIASVEKTAASPPTVLRTLIPGQGNPSQIEKPFLYLSDIEHMRLEAHVYPGIVVETHFVSDARSGQRRVPITKVWNIDRVLGEGGVGEVRLQNLLAGSETRAVKRVLASGSDLKNAYERELKALTITAKQKYKDAAVFVDFYGWFQDHECLYLAMEYVPLGDLEKNLPPNAGLKEGEIRDISTQILEGLKIMHFEQFAHRDLKPKNILVCRGSPNWWVKIADFGLSKQWTEETGLRTLAGTQAYMAPETLNYIVVRSLNSEYTTAVDLWALGCLVYRLATGAVPFPPGLSLGKYCEDKLKLPFQTMALNSTGLRFVQELLVPHPSGRLTAKQALQHPWICSSGKDIEVVEKAARLSIEGSGWPATDPYASLADFNTDTHPGLRTCSVSTTYVMPAESQHQNWSNTPPSASATGLNTSR